MHDTVLKKETIQMLEIAPDKVFVDTTLGEAGHFEEAIKSAKFNGTFIGLDVSAKNIEISKSKLGLKFEEKAIDVNGTSTKIWVNKSKELNIILINTNFSNLIEVLHEIEVANVDYILADLGVSTEQYENVEGLSYMRLEDNLDMWLDSNLKITASEILEIFRKSELIEILKTYGDFNGKEAELIANSVEKFKRTKKIQTVKDLVQICDEIKKIQSIRLLFARIFQVLRMVVNGEIYNLKVLLLNGFEILNHGGKFAIISFHSGEDRIVKTFIKKNKTKLTKLNKFTRPSAEEILLNPRARSAVLRVFKKL